MSRPPFSRPTGQDVARLAGVSQATVSLVLSGKAKGRVSQELQERVREASNKLGYVPSAAASTLRRGRSGAIGLVVPDVTNPFLGRVLRGAQREASQDLYTVLLIEPSDARHWQLAALPALKAAAIDGLLLFAIDPPPRSEQNELGPLVLIEGLAEGFAAVNIDVCGGAEMVFAHLRAHGHVRLGHVACAYPAATFRARGARWDELIGDAADDGVTNRDVYVQFDLESARLATEQLLRSGDRPTALFCDDDLLAAGAMLAARTVGLAVPEEISIVGFAGTILSEVTYPQITTVATDAEELGARAARTLLRAVQGAGPADVALQPMRLVTRGSTGPVPR